MTVQTRKPSDPSSTIAVLPLLPTSRTRSHASVWSTTLNLVRTITEGSARPSSASSDDATRSDARDNENADDDDDDDEGASSFVYTARSPVSHAGSEMKGAEVPWHIANRYYEAEVVLRAFRPEQVEQWLPLRTTTAKERVKAPEAVRVERPAATGDVFEALSRPPPTGAIPAHPPPADLRAAAKELDEIPAVVLLVDSSAPLQAHQRILTRLSELPIGQREGDDEEEVETGLSGFGKEVSLVIGIASPQPLSLNDNLAPASSSLSSYTSAAGRPPSLEELTEVYAADGWEFIELGGGRLDESSEEEEEEEEASDLGGPNGEAAEAEGVERIREALMAYMWPGLIRKQDERRGTSHRFAGLAHDHDSLPVMQTTQTGFSDWAVRSDPNDSIDDHDGLDVAATDRGRTFPTFDDIHATPDETDEALARAFLARLSSFPEPIADEHGESPAASRFPLPTNPHALQQLEDFLESQDPAWPTSQSSAVQHQHNAAPNTHGTSERSPSTTTSTANIQPTFEDDFDDFVSASAPFPNRETDHDSDNHTDDWMQAPLPSSSDVARMRTAIFGSHFPFSLETDDTSPSLRPDVDTEGNRLRDGTDADARAEPPRPDLMAQLSALQMHAERVRAIPDQEQRKREAALVAMAFSSQVGGGGGLGF